MDPAIGRMYSEVKLSAAYVLAGATAGSDGSEKKGSEYFAPLDRREITNGKIKDRRIQGGNFTNRMEGKKKYDQS